MYSTCAVLVCGLMVAAALPSDFSGQSWSGDASSWNSDQGVVIGSDAGLPKFASNAPGFTGTIDSTFYPNDPFNPLGVTLGGLISTGITIALTIFGIVFVFAFIRNMLNSKLVTDLFDGRSIDMDEVARISRSLVEAYQKYN